MAQSSSHNPSESPLLSSPIPLPTKLYQKKFFVAMIGTTIEYYDASLYGFMAPLIASFFFPHQNPVWSMIYSFALYPLSIITAPLGAWTFGKIGDSFGRKTSLTIAIAGMIITTGLMAFMPTYYSVGILAPILLASAKMLQSFFAAGEYNGGAIYALEHRDSHSPPGYISGLYCFFTVLGIVSASLAVTVVANTSLDYWRYPYLFSFALAIVGFALRKKAKETPEFIRSKPSSDSLLTIIKQNKLSFTAGIGAAFFFSVLYCVPALFMNAFIPLITQLSPNLVHLLNFLSLIIYMFFLLLGGYLSDKFRIASYMQVIALIVIITIIPIFNLLTLGNLESVIIVKSALAILGGLFIGPFHAWIQQLFPVRNRYRLISLSYTIGAQLGGLTPALALFLWNLTSSIQIPAILILLSAIIGLTVMLLHSKFFKPSFSSSPQ